MRATALVLALALPAAQAEPRASIDLLPEASVASGHVVLGDVARLHAKDLGTMRALVNLPVGRAPLRGETAVLHRTDLAQWIRRHVGIAPDALAWSGAQETRVRRAVPRLKGEEIARAAVEAVRAGIGANARVTTEPRGVPRDLDVPEGKLRLEVRGADPGPSPHPPMVWVDIWGERGFVRSVPVRLEVAAARTQAAGSPSGDGPLQAPARAASVAEERHAPLAVARGEWALLRSTEGSITLESRVEVLQDGRPGQRIRVRAQAGAGTLFARVIGPGRLELAP